MHELATINSSYQIQCMVFYSTELRLRHSDHKGPDINGHNKEYLNNYSSYTFLLCDITFL